MQEDRVSPDVCRSVVLTYYARPIADKSEACSSAPS